MYCRWHSSGTSTKNTQSKLSGSTGAKTDTIVAIATPPGRGGIGVIRLSGPSAWAIAAHLAGKEPSERSVKYAYFKNAEGVTLDTGLTVGFKQPPFLSPVKTLSKYKGMVAPWFRTFCLKSWFD